MPRNPDEPFTPFSHEEFMKRYYVHRLAALAIVVRENEHSVKELLLAKQIRFGKLIWSLPGGLLEKGESINTAVIREVEEETNIKIKPTGIIGVNNWAGKSIFSDDPFNQCGIGFIVNAEYISGDPKPDGEEVFDAKFFTDDEFKDINLSKQVIDYYKASLTNDYLNLEINQFTDQNTYRYQYYNRKK